MTRKNKKKGCFCESMFNPCLDCIKHFRWIETPENMKIDLLRVCKFHKIENKTDEQILNYGQLSVDLHSKGFDVCLVPNYELKNI